MSGATAAPGNVCVCTWGPSDWCAMTGVQTTHMPSPCLQIIDFGTSDFCLSGQRLSQKFGTPYYVSRGAQCSVLVGCLRMARVLG